MNENNKNQNQGQKTSQGDTTKPQKQGGMTDKPVNSPGQSGANAGNVVANQDPNKNPIKTPGQKGNINQGVGDKQTSSNPNKMDDDLDDDKATQRTQRPNGDRDQQK